MKRVTEEGDAMRSGHGERQSGRSFGHAISTPWAVRRP
jgi:hypothetical protein